MQRAIPVCSKCNSPVVLEPGVNGEKNIWFVCNNCNLNFPVYMNEGFQLTQIQGYIPVMAYSEDNPLCLCDHTQKYHKQGKNCMGCDCIEFDQALIL